MKFSKIQKPSLMSLVCTSPRHRIQDHCSPRIQVMGNRPSDFGHLFCVLRFVCNFSSNSVQNWMTQQAVKCSPPTPQHLDSFNCYGQTFKRTTQLCQRTKKHVFGIQKDRAWFIIIKVILHLHVSLNVGQPGHSCLPQCSLPLVLGGAHKV